MIKKQENKTRRHERIRAKIKGTKEIPRVAVFRSNKYVSAQVIDDVAHSTLMNISGPKNKPEPIGEKLAKKAIEAGITKIVFDRGGNKYHGRIKAFADGLRKGGLNF